MQKRWHISFEIILILTVLISHIYVATRPPNSLMNWYSSDDAFYYYKVAQNISEGKGITFDGLSSTNGFHPLWMLVCIPVFALAHFNLILPLRVLVMVLAMLNAGTGVLLYRICKQLLSTPAAVLIACFWVFLPRIQQVVTQLGLEAGVSVFCTALLVYLIARWQAERPQKGDPLWRMLGIAGAGILTLFARLDNAFTVFFAGLYMVLLAWRSWDGIKESLKTGWLRRFRTGVTYFAPVGVALGLYLLVNYLYAGTPMPISGSVKRWWSTMDNTVYGAPILGWRNFISYWFTNIQNTGPWALITDVPNRLADFVYGFLNLQGSELFLKNVNRGLVAGFALLLAGLAGWLVVKNWRITWKALVRFSILPLFLGCTGQIASYRLVPYVHTRQWYWAVEMLVITLVLGIVADGLVQQVRRWKVNSQGIWTGVGGLVVVLFYAFATTTVHHIPPSVLPENANNYKLEALGIERLTEPGSLVGCTGAGLIGYFIQDRTVVPLDGLINGVEYFQKLKAGKGYEYLDEIGLDYVWGNKYMITISDPYGAMFNGRLEEVDHVEGGNVYRYIPGIRP
jgi:hypothetical protein